MIKTKGGRRSTWPHYSPKDIKMLSGSWLGICAAGNAFLPDSVDKKIRPTFEPRITSTPRTLRRQLCLVFNGLEVSKDILQRISKPESCIPACLQVPQMERRKDAEGPRGVNQSIQEIETSLPPPRGPDASVAQYVRDFKAAKKMWNDSYNGSNGLYQSHAWNSQRAQEEEY